MISSTAAMNAHRKRDTMPSGLHEGNERLMPHVRSCGCERECCNSEPLCLLHYCCIPFRCDVVHAVGIYRDRLSVADRSEDPPRYWRISIVDFRGIGGMRRSLGPPLPSARRPSEGRKCREALGRLSQRHLAYSGRP